jgi:hypothetical protein
MLQSFLSGAGTGSMSFGDEWTTRATSSCPKNSRTFWTSSFFALQLVCTAACSCSFRSRSARASAIFCSYPATIVWTSRAVSAVSPAVFRR